MRGKLHRAAISRFALRGLAVVALLVVAASLEGPVFGLSLGVAQTMMGLGAAAIGLGSLGRLGTKKVRARATAPRTARATATG